MKSTFMSQLLSMGKRATYSVTVQVKDGGGATPAPPLLQA